MMPPEVWVPLGTAILSIVLTAVVREISRRVQLFDVPNARSSHAEPTPRLGGVAITVSALCGCVAGLWWDTSDASSLWLWMGATAAAGVGLADDLHGLGPAAKIVGQVAVASAAVYYGSAALGLDLFWACIAAFSIVAFANIFNFMDGSDGLAAGMAVLFAAGLMVLHEADHRGGGDVAFTAAVTIAAAAGFLVLNWAPASIFMGDTGSLFLGFLLAGLSWQVVAAGVSPVAVALVFLPFAGDGGWTLLMRASRRERIWTAHRSHIYQRLLIAGSSHSSVALLYCAWGVLAVAMALGYERGQVAVMTTMVSLAVGSIAAMELLARAREREHGASKNPRPFSSTIDLVETKH
jgi:UDP-N-acetylmuramyl pentapeptide phosphotransferase/UDP-N-acetylglucosamine-1-phosphate transferase